MTRKKDTFKKDNPALNFITAVDDTESNEVTKKTETAKTVITVFKTTTPKGYKLDPKYIELKTKRIQLLLQPSVVEKAKEVASRKKISMNEAFNEAIQLYIKMNTEEEA